MAERLGIGCSHVPMILSVKSHRACALPRWQRVWGRARLERAFDTRVINHGGSIHKMYLY